MSKRTAYYFPALAYIALLLLVWLLSWIIGVVNIVDDGNSINSLMTSEGLRWALRSSAQSVNDAPWGGVMLMLVIFGLLDCSGLLRLFGDIISFSTISVNRRRAAYMALLALLLYVCLLCLSVVSPWRLLMGVTDDVSSSPIMRGWMLLLFMATLFVSVIYGYVYGNFRTATDVISGVGCSVAKYIPAMLAMLPATAVLSCLQYMGLPASWGLSDVQMEYAGILFYLLPFLFVAFLNLRTDIIEK